jgi:hypothetical protein
LTTIERQKNILTLESIFSESMGNAVRSLLPVKSILREYLDEEEDAKQEEPKEESHEVVAPLEETKQPEKEVVEDLVETASVPEPPVNEVVELVEEAPKEKTPVNEVLEPVDTPKAPKAKAPKQSLRLEKMDTPPGAPMPVGSDHTVELPPVASGIQVAKEPEAPTMQIETEPSVHFTPYDTVFDTASDSEIRYTPKLSVEEKPPSTWGMEPDEDLGPTLVISNGSSDIGLEDIQDLEPPVLPPAAEEEDIDAPLSLTSDFVELN